MDVVSPPSQMTLVSQLSTTVLGWCTQYSKYAPVLPMSAATLTTLIVSVRAGILSTLSRGLKRGELVIVEGTEEHNFGVPEPGRHPVRLTIRNPNFWMRIFLSHDMGCTWSTHGMVNVY